MIDCNTTNAIQLAEMQYKFMTTSLVIGFFTIVIVETGYLIYK